MEEPLDRRGGGGLVLMILTVVLGALILYFIKGRYATMRSDNHTIQHMEKTIISNNGLL